ncbi:hypothetical protein CBS147320_6735 [Aspergillus niger]|nr:hypothetical protein CBS147320_6735 [Aspergillus niger]KAI2998472.1 hypothetical protein CBS147346_8133 [Aspergillus niger]
MASPNQIYNSAPLHRGDFQTGGGDRRPGGKRHFISSFDLVYYGSPRSSYVLLIQWVFVHTFSAQPGYHDSHSLKVAAQAVRLG